MAERMCEYGDCQETKIVVSVNDRVGEVRPGFCCAEHAGLWLLRYAWMTEGKREESFAGLIANKLHHDLRR